MENENMYTSLYVHSHAECTASYIITMMNFKLSPPRKLQMNEKLFSRIYFAFMFVYLRDH